MSAAQPPSAPSDGPPVGSSELAAGVGAVGSGTQGQQVVDDVVVEEWMKSIRLMKSQIIRELVQVDHI